MPRPLPLVRMKLPEIRPAVLTHHEHNRFAELLGVNPMPDMCCRAIAELIGSHRGALHMVKGHTAARVATALGRVEKRISRGHNDVREITDPLFGIDEETHVRLPAVVTNPSIPISFRFGAVETRRIEVEMRPEVDARHGLRVVLAAHALVCVWYLFAAGRGDKTRQWLFVLAILEAAGELSAGMRKNPKRLKPLKSDVERLLRLTSQSIGVLKTNVPKMWMPAKP